MKLENCKVLLTGGHGTLGKELLSLFKVLGTKVSAPARKDLDVWNILGLMEEIEEGEHDIVIHAAAWTDVPGAEERENQGTVLDTNVIGSSNVAYAAKKYGAKVVYISTDYVYDCLKGNYSTEDKAVPRTFYGFSKLAGESFFSLDEDLIIRTSFAKRGTWGTKRKQYGEAFVDSYTSKDWVDVIAPLILESISQESTGIVNIGTERKSIYELAQQEFPEVERVSVADKDLPYEYPLDSSLKSSI